MAIELQPIVARRYNFYIKGLSILVPHAWSEKALRMLRMTAAERKKEPKTKRDPETEARESCYYTDGGELGLPLMAFKSAIIGAAHKDYGIEKTLVRKALFLPSEDSGNIVPLEYESARVREDIVRVGMSQTDLRYRTEFTNWRAKIVADLEVSLLTPENLATLVDRAGFSVGVCEWRPEKGGEWGRFELDKSEQMVEVE